MGQHIGAKFEELGGILKAVDSPRLRICLDTQHSFAAGYDLTTPEGVEAMIAQFDEAVGLENLAAVHANDSKQLCGSGVDRHDNIGEGFIGEAGFEAIMSNPAFNDVPFFLEVPGFEGKGPDQRNVDILKGIRARVGVSAPVGATD
jgi:deoxyribonuclease-4